MSYFEVKSGLWEKSEEIYKGTVDATLSARCVRGSEADADYIFIAKVKVYSGKAALIVNYTLSEDWEEQYLEMIFDPTNDKVTLDGVVRNADGTEKTRTTLASRNMSLEFETYYHCHIISKTLSDDSKAVYGIINDLVVVKAEDLAPAFSVGMHGLECLGTADQYTEFSKLQKYQVV
jgi:hypothetical protein